MKLLDPDRSRLIIAFRDHHASSLLAAASLLFTVLLGHRIPLCDAGKKFIKPETCPSSHYFHTFSLQCVPCWNQNVPLWLANQTAVISSPPPSDRSQCHCPDQYRMRLTNGKFDCIPIAACRGAEPGACSQCHSSLLSSSSLSSDGHVCRDNCPQPLGQWLLEDGQCLPVDKIISAEKLLAFSTINYHHRRSKSSLVSKFIYSSLRPALFNCRFHLNQTACQYLINVLSLKSAAEQLGVTGKQDSLQALREKIHEALVDGFNLTGSGGSPTSVDRRFRDQFQCQPSRSPGNNRLDLLDLQFHANGSLLQFGAILLDQLSPCSSSHHYQSGLDGGKLFVGVHLHRQFWCRADKLGTRNTENTFHQLFSSSQSPDTEDLYPFLNPTGLGRFFLANTLLGQDAFKPEWAGPEFILYARSITLVIIVQSSLRSDTPSIIPSICPESIRIQYDSLEKNTAVDQLLLRTELKVQYRMADNLDPDVDHQILMIFGLVIILLLAIVWSGFRTWCLMNRTGHRRWEWKILAIFAYHLIVVSMSNILLVAILVWCLNRTMVYKYQTVVHVLMLDHDQELALVHCLLIIFCLKMVQLMITIRHSTSMEMFLIDWEKPKNNNQNNNKNDHFDHFLGKSSSNNNNNNNNLVVEMINQKWRSKHKGEPAIPEAMMDNVSVWRRIFVANEWSELSTVRRINLSLHLLLLTTILESAYFHRFYKLAPELYFTSTMVDDLDDEIPESLTIRLTITATIYLALVLIQYLYQKWFKENFFGSKLREFVDLCSVSNISVFCLVHRRYGYYIHGLSPHGQSDVGMLQMYRLLDIEPSDLCSKRGLSPNTDQQTFQMYLPAVVHDYLQAIRHGTRSTDSEDSKKRSIPADDDYGNDDPIQSMRISTGINQFLTSFIAHQFPKADYIVEEKRGLQAMLDFESHEDSDSVSEGIGFFYNDSNDLMENVLLYGLEPIMIIVELVIYLLMDVWWRNFIIAALITYCASMAIRRLFGQLFRQNLIQKALIDERFLF